MIESIRQISHKLYQPKTIYQDISNAFQCLNSQRVEKIIHCALPILSNYKPLSTPISILISSAQILTDVNLLAGSIKDQESIATSTLKFIKVSISIMNVAATVFNFKLGLLASNSYTIINAFYGLSVALHEKNSAHVCENLVKLITSSLYLGVLVTGSIEISIACTCFQILLSAFENIENFQKGNWMEFASSCIQIGIKVNQSFNQYELLQKRNAFLKLEKYQALLERLDQVRKISHFDSDHPLFDLENQIIEKETNSFGAHFSELGNDVVKGMNLEFRLQGDDESKIKMDFNITTHKRQALLNAISELEKINQNDLKDLLSIFDIPIDGIKVQRSLCSFDHAYKNLDEILKKDFKETKHEGWDYSKQTFQIVEVIFEGIGSLRIASSDEYWYMRTHVQVFLEKGKDLYDIHTALSLVGLDTALWKSTEEAIERMKIIHLLKVFYPSFAHYLDGVNEFFTSPVSEIKEKIFATVPSSKLIFDRFYDKITAYEIFPGKFRLKIEGLKEYLTELGALGLTSAIWTEKDPNGRMKFDRIISILQAGLLSSEARFANGNNATGYSKYSDQYTGGGESVFTQMIVESNQSFKEISYQAELRVLIDLEAIESGTYQYSFDANGWKRKDQGHYDLAMAVDKLPQMIQQLNNFSCSHEIMIKERVLPEWITGIVVASDELKQQLIQELREKQLIRLNDLKEEVILDIKVDQFIHVGDQVKRDQFNRF